MKSLVTGGAGFIGSTLVRELARRGDDVVIVDNLAGGRKDNIPSGMPFYNLDLRDPSSLDMLQDILSEVDYVFHLAAMNRAQRSINDPIMSNNVNVNGTLNCLHLSSIHQQTYHRLTPKYFYAIIHSGGVF